MARPEEAGHTYRLTPLGVINKYTKYEVSHLKGIKIRAR
jgi:hypothetical protein